MRKVDVEEDNQKMRERDGIPLFLSISKILLPETVLLHIATVQFFLVIVE